MHIRVIVLITWQLQFRQLL